MVLLYVVPEYYMVYMLNLSFIYHNLISINNNLQTEFIWFYPKITTKRMLVKKV